MAAVMMAALLSSLTSIFNSASIIFTLDLWKILRKEATEKELLIISKLFILFLVLCGVAWIPVITHFNSSHLYVYIQVIESYQSPRTSKCKY